MMVGSLRGPSPRWIETAAVGRNSGTLRTYHGYGLTVIGRRGAACLTSFSTGRKFRDAASSFALRLKMQGPPISTWRAAWRATDAAILLYLGGRIGLAPTDENGRLWTHQIKLTITDIVKEVYNSHHPIDEDKWFHEQKDEAIARAAVFRQDRMPKFLGRFERILEANPAGTDHLVGSSVTYADLSLFQLVEGLRFMFPLASERKLAKLPRVMALHEAVAERPRLAAYLASERRLPFGEPGSSAAIRSWMISMKYSVADLTRQSCDSHGRHHRSKTGNEARGRGELRFLLSRLSANH